MTGNLLYAEDDENDVFLIKRALAKIGFKHELTVVPNGLAMIEKLSEAKSGKRTLPTLVVLDLKMPEMNGLEALSWIRAQSEFSKLPVVLFSSSTQPTDILEAGRLGANAYLVKPSSPPALQDLLRRLHAYMLAASSLDGWWPIPDNELLPAPTSAGAALV